MELEDRYLKPTDIPLIITSTNSSPEALRKKSDSVQLLSSRSPEKQEETGAKRKNSEKRKLSDAQYKLNADRKSLGGSLKYEIGRNRSASNLITVPAKWSSVRIRGTGFNDSRKSVVKIEPCNGIGNVGVDYKNLKNAHHNNMKNIGEVSAVVVSIGVLLNLFMCLLATRFVHFPTLFMSIFYFFTCLIQKQFPLRQIVFFKN